METLTTLSPREKNNLRLIEDCAQAHLAKWQGKPVGTFGDIATFSFYPGKNLGAAGDAGFILTQSKDLHDFTSRYVDHGRREKYLHDFFGSNFRMDGLQAAILSVKLPHLSKWTAQRREKAAMYDQLLKNRFPVLQPSSEAEPVYHLYVVEIANRDEVMKHFKSQDIGCGVHYPVTLNQQPAFKSLGYSKGQFPVSERISERLLSLPFYPEITSAQQEYVVGEFLKVAKV